MEPVVGFVRGIDISHHQGPSVDFKAVARSGRDFCVCRWAVATTPDRHRERNVEGSLAAGLVTGVYGVVGAVSDPEESAERMVSQVRALVGARPLLWVLDAETISGGGNPSYSEVTRYAATLERLTGRPPIAYVPKWWMSGHAESSRFPGELERCSWWQSHYLRDPSPPASRLDDGYPSWRGWEARFWQFTSSASVPGVAGRCDDNVYYGTAASLRALAAGEEDDMPSADEIREIMRDVLREAFAKPTGHTAPSDWARELEEVTHAAKNNAREAMEAARSSADEVVKLRTKLGTVPVPKLSDEQVEVIAERVAKQLVEAGAATPEAVASALATVLGRARIVTEGS